MTTHRRERVADRVREALARALREEVRDPRVGFVTVTGVELTPDLRNARVWVSTLGDAEQREQSLEALEHAAPFLRRLLAREAGLRFTPRLEFRTDRSIEGGARLEKLLDDLHRDHEPEDA